MKLTLDDSSFFKDLINITEYSVGFLDGVQDGKTVFLERMGTSAIESLKEFIDSNAKVSPATLQHVYEWYQTGSPDSRLFDIKATVSNSEISFFANFRQSTSIQNGSMEPFYNKAKIMEEGRPVTIKPVKANVLSFDVGAEHVFSKGPITILNPGGDQAQHGLDNVMEAFFNNFFSQSFLRSSGILDKLQNPIMFKKGLAAGKSRGKSVGVEVGYNWITKETAL